MRVIAGTYRSRPLAAPRGLATRPTSDRLRETLFNVLGGRIQGASFADLYAGSGAVGIEALSHGAGQAWFVESTPSAVAVIRRNLASLSIQTGFRIEARPVATVLRDLSRHPVSQPWDVVFLDPPYQAAEEYERTLTALGEDLVVAPGGIVIAEHRREGRAKPRRLALAESYGSLHRFRVLEQGDASLSFYEAVSSE